VHRKIKEARAAREAATDYAGWMEASLRLDELQGLDQWRLDDASDDYDWRLIRSRLQQLRQLRAQQPIGPLLVHLRQGLHWNLGNIGNPRLFSHCRVGTKVLVTRYIDEICEALRHIADVPDDQLSHAEKLHFFHETALSFGRSALMLSGGASFGLFHVGVVRALFREGLLPNVLSGSSAGSVVAAKLGTHRPEDLGAMLEPEQAYYQFWKMLPMTQMLRRRVMMDQTQLRRALSRNIRDMTFEEAHRLSGRTINITVSPAGTNQPPRLLNHVTFPYLFLREAVLASCAVPLLFPPVMLMTRADDGEREPYLPLLRWNDGSLKSDLPVMRMRRLHNVNHFIVSQTNPHVVPFLVRREPGGFNLRHTLSQYAYSTVVSQADALSRVASSILPMKRLRKPFEMASSVLSQDYSGNVNIFPRFRIASYVELIRNPTLAAVKRFMLEGERSAWSRMEMVRTQTAISQTLQQCVEQLERRQPDPFERRMNADGRLKVVRKRQLEN